MLLKLISTLKECASPVLLWDHVITWHGTNFSSVSYCAPVMCHIPAISCPKLVLSPQHCTFLRNFWCGFQTLLRGVFCLQWIVEGCAICIYDSVDHVTSPKHFKFLKIVSWLTTAFSHVSMKSTLRSESFCLDFFFLLLRLKQPRYIWYLANNEKLCLISGCSVKHHYKTKVIQTCFSTSLMKWLLWLFSSWSHQGTGTIKVMMW